MDEPGLMDVCIPNIGPAQRRRRLFSGIVMAAVGIGLLAAFAAFSAGHLWGLVLFLPYWGGATGVFQALEKT
ncbi:MAG: hypothetical protein GEU73_01760 [Chloroflexi bacterium]|nr:hypothetical protein [Chloroflexota bacterium]